MRNRFWRNLLTTRYALRRAFPPPALAAIERAVGESERQHSGEIRFAIETALDIPALLRGTSARDRAIAAFARLGTWDTASNNGVLIYLLLAERDIEIVADRGLTGKVSLEEWQAVCDGMREAFARGDFEAGSVQGIRRVGELIAHHFPPEPGDADELPDSPVLL